MLVVSSRKRRLKWILQLERWGTQLLKGGKWIKDKLVTCKAVQGSVEGLHRDNRVSSTA